MHLPSEPTQNRRSPSRPEPWFIRFGSPLTFSLCASAFFISVFNLRFWREAAGIFWRGGVADGLFLLNLAICLVLLHALALLILPGRKAPAVAIALLCPVAAMAAYCADNFGLPVDSEMIRNIGRTDYREVQGLFSYKIVLYVLVLGVLPVFLVARSRIAAVGWKRRLLQHAGLLGAFVASAAILAWAFPEKARTLGGSHRQIHYLLVPGAALNGAVQFSKTAWAAPPGQPSSIRAHTTLSGRPAGAKPLLVFFVIGETARHMNFQLGGYARSTNPQLSGVGGLFYFSHVESCATTTALSVPCMLSPLGRAHFSLNPGSADGQVLRELAQAGIGIQWRANNSGSRQIRAGFDTVDASVPGAFPACSPWSCVDEVLLGGLEKHLLQSGGDRLIVFHQMGSHGPDYFRRYPPSFEVFKPACRTNVLSECSQEEIRNAYDNTIVYTDHLLKAKIDLLNRMADEFDTALVYVSDHGESLGEGGVHLHGAPYSHAPAEQKRVPLIVWLSKGYMHRKGLTVECMNRRIAGHHSHDNLYHTLLGAMQAGNAAYDPALDLMASCGTPRN